MQLEPVEPPPPEESFDEVMRKLFDPELVKNISRSIDEVLGLTDPELEKPWGSRAIH